jgi:hypothetical protein
MGNPVELEDEDDRGLEEYTKSLSAILESTSIIILNTTSGSIILKPSSISSIFVMEQQKSLRIVNQKTEDLISDS